MLEYIKTLPDKDPLKSEHRAPVKQWVTLTPEKFMESLKTDRVRRYVPAVDLHNLNET